MTAPNDNMNEVCDIGLRIYESDLKAILEPMHNNEYVVIQVDTGDYALGQTYYAALRAMRRRHPADGRLVGMKIGPEPELGLAARMTAAQSAGGARK